MTKCQVVINPQRRVSDINIWAVNKGETITNIPVGVPVKAGMQEPGMEPGTVWKGSLQ